MEKEAVFNNNNNNNIFSSLVSFLFVFFFTNIHRPHYIRIKTYLLELQTQSWIPAKLSTFCIEIGHHECELHYEMYHDYIEIKQQKSVVEPLALVQSIHYLAGLIATEIFQLTWVASVHSQVYSQTQNYRQKTCAGVQNPWAHLVEGTPEWRVTKVRWKCLLINVN